MLRINEDELVSLSVFGEVSSPVSDRSPYTVSADGQPVVLPGVGGITYNVKVGDTAINWEADHVEPAVSIKNANKDSNAALNLFACVGNRAWVSSGDAKGSEGCVTGKHGGIEHVLADFEDSTLDKLAIGDKIMIKGRGVGLKFLDYPEVKIMNLAPELLSAMPIKAEKGMLLVQVTHKVPAGTMGSGLGSHHTYRGDYDRQLFDGQTVKEYNLDKLCLGDVVAIMDADHSFGRIYRQGAVTVGVVVHTDSVTAGHGPGITTLFTSSKGRLKPIMDKSANIAKYLNIGRFRQQKGRKK